MSIDALAEQAHKLGADHGRAAASWYFDGNTDAETCGRVLRGIEDGDPEILDTLPDAPLSGEWADDPTPASVLAELGVSEEDDSAGDLLDAYEQGFYETSRDEIERTARANAWTDVNEDQRYSLNGVAWYVVRRSPDGSQVHAVMVGDDAVHTLDASDLTPIGEEDYCPSCGQIGCPWH